MKIKKVFLDTNILFYLYSDQDKSKKKTIINWLDAHQYCQFYISIQVQKELYVSLTKKLKLDKLEVRSVIQKTNKLNVVVNTTDQVERAMELNILHSLSFFDGLIFAAAEFEECHILLSEDMQNEFSLKGLQILNPFK